jgi:hypothetical protein
MNLPLLKRLGLIELRKKMIDSNEKSRFWRSMGKKVSFPEGIVFSNLCPLFLLMKIKSRRDPYGARLPSGVCCPRLLNKGKGIPLVCDPKGQVIFI